jgi:hypothetical protein
MGGVPVERICHLHFRRLTSIPGAIFAGLLLGVIETDSGVYRSG